MEDRNRADLRLSRLTPSSLVKPSTTTSTFQSNTAVPTVLPSLEAYVEAYRSLMAQDATAMSSGFPLQSPNLQMPVLSSAQFISPSYFGLPPFPVDFTQYSLLSPVLLPPFVASLYCDPAASFQAQHTVKCSTGSTPTDRKLSSSRDVIHDAYGTKVPHGHLSQMSNQNVTHSNNLLKSAEAVYKQSKCIPGLANNTKNNASGTEHRTNVYSADKKPSLSKTLSTEALQSHDQSPKSAPLDFSTSSQQEFHSKSAVDGVDKVVVGGALKSPPVSVKGAGASLSKEFNSGTWCGTSPLSADNNYKPAVSYLDMQDLCDQKKSILQSENMPKQLNQMKSQNFPTAQSQKYEPGAALGDLPKNPSVVSCDKLPHDYHASLIRLPHGSKDVQRLHTVDHPAVSKSSMVSPGYMIPATDLATKPQVWSMPTVPGQQRQHSRPNRKRSQELRSSNSETDACSNMTTALGPDGKPRLNPNSVGIDEFRCRLCNYSGRSQHCLSKHYRAHDLAYKICRYCRRAFERPSDLLRHEERHRRRDTGITPTNGVPAACMNDVGTTYSVFDRSRCAAIGRVESYAGGVVSTSNLVEVKLGSGDNEIILDFDSPPADALLDGQIPPESSKLRDVYSIMAGIVVVPPMFAMEHYQLPASTPAEGCQQTRSQQPDRKPSISEIVSSDVPRSDTNSSIGEGVSAVQEAFLNSLGLQVVKPDSVDKQRDSEERKRGHCWTGSIYYTDKENITGHRQERRRKGRPRRVIAENSTIDANDNVKSVTTEHLQVKLNTGDNSSLQLTSLVNSFGTSTSESSRPQADEVCKMETDADVTNCQDASLSNVTRCSDHLSPSGTEVIVMTCIHCRYSTTSQFKYQLHMRIHQSRGICKACNTGFIKTSDLIWHWFSHNVRTGSGQYNCDWCRFTSPVHSTISRHIYRHMKNHRIQMKSCSLIRLCCGLCGRLVPRTHMYMHKRFVHGRFIRFSSCKSANVNLSAAVSETFSCTKCSQRFSTLRHLLRHHSVRHRQQRLPAGVAAPERVGDEPLKLTCNCVNKSENEPELSLCNSHI